MSAPIVVDLFAGSGGWDQGLRLAGHTGTSIGLERDHAACRTAVAAGHLRIRCDVATYPPAAFGQVDGLTASPPCQSFSRTRHGAGFDDPRGLLSHEPLRWAAALRPRWIALEQVPAVLPHWHHVARRLRALGYTTWTGLLNAADYGAPQVRRRACLLARRDGRTVHAPVPTHAQHPTGPDLFGEELHPWPVMADALDWADDGTHPAWTFTRPSTTVCGTDRVGRPGRKDWEAGESQFAVDAAHLTVAEAGVLQSFPAAYPWQGTKTQRLQQAGNAIPPVLAAALVASLLVATTRELAAA